MSDVTLESVKAMLTSLTHAEKAELLQQIARDLGDAFPGVVSTPEINGGEATITRTHIPVWLLVQTRNDGDTEADILYTYPKLRAEDLANAWSYYRAHKTEIDARIRENKNAKVLTREDARLEQVMLWADQLDRIDQAKLRYHLKEDKEYPEEWIRAREIIRSELLEAGFLAAVPVQVSSDDMADLSDEELDELGTLPPGSPTVEQLIDEDRGPR